jgi:hypothetical protein
METMMAADRRALTIVTVFLGVVMFGSWIAHACAVYKHDHSTSDLQHRSDAPRVPIGQVDGEVRCAK